MLQPFRCKPIYKEKVWGGRWLSDSLGRTLPEDVPIGESWELACRSDAMSEILDGEFAGRSLLEVIQTHAEQLLGKRVCEQGIDPFPLLIKFLDANDCLSVQVHPNDDSAQRVKPGELGKTEMWYILDAEPGATLIMGVTKGVTTAEFAEAIQAGELHKYLTEVPVKPGDAFYIPAGTVHAIKEGIRVAEIQQNSDTTYRVYDWNRLGLDGKPRELHIQEALDVINFQLTGVEPHLGVILQGEHWESRLVTACNYFAVEELQIRQLTHQMNPERFEIWMVLEGSGEIRSMSSTQMLERGHTWVIPASAGELEVTGSVKILRSYIPDLKQEIVDPLLAQGYTLEELTQRVGGLKEFTR